MDLIIEPQWQENLGRNVYPVYAETNHPKWRYQRWEDIAQTDRDVVETKLREILAMFPQQIQDNIVDIEIVGSFAFGNAHIMSDLDITFVPIDELVQTYRNMWWGNGKYENGYGEIYEKTLEFGCKQFIKMEVMFGLSAKSSCCYSFNEHILYGRGLGQSLAKKCKYNLSTGLYEMIDYEPKTVDILRDIWAE